MKIHDSSPARAAWAATAFARLPVEAHPIVVSPNACAALIAVVTTRSLNESVGCATESFFTHARATPSLSASRGTSMSGVKPVSRECTGSPLNGSHSLYLQSDGARRAISSRSGSARDLGYSGSSGPRQCSQMAFGAGSLSAPHRRHRCGRTAKGAAFAGRVARTGDGVAVVDMSNGRLVLGNRGIHFIAPPQDSTREIPDAAETRGLELPHRLRAAHSAPAMHDDVARAVQCRQRLGELAKRNQPRAGNPRDVPLVRFTNVDEVELIARALALRELARRHLWKFAVTLRLGGRLRHAAQLLVVDQLGDLVRAASWALGILAKIHRVEARIERIHEQQPANERLSNAEYQLDRLR